MKQLRKVLPRRKGNKTNTLQLPGSTPVLGGTQEESGSQQPSQSSPKTSTAYQAGQTTGAVAEIAIDILKELAPLVPVAGPALSHALAVVSKLIKISHVGVHMQNSTLVLGH
ncbi:hypothetical protein GYMLUDRAFT_702622 [Collybiopsis luxurians FD-317 M1]|uniref:Unplaced genomic scaffold GYMLUscaffold_38, whole genome shotgun sequence n=1 Tax=Collybiopsis luxurians FD-317 M1 TaxID=944289 RepID=A0A0D0CJ09_9AGAR|nr:hypothetical protein GYMLUDRAFT_702622 [Collybiopsis luxurians FD-317 M1]